MTILIGSEEEEQRNLRKKNFLKVIKELEIDLCGDGIENANYFIDKYLLCEDIEEIYLSANKLSYISTLHLFTLNTFISFLFFIYIVWWVVVVAFDSLDFILGCIVLFFFFLNTVSNVIIVAVHRYKLETTRNKIIQRYLSPGSFITDVLLESNSDKSSNIIHQQMIKNIVQYFINASIFIFVISVFIINIWIYSNNIIGLCIISFILFILTIDNKKNAFKLSYFFYEMIYRVMKDPKFSIYLDLYKKHYLLIGPSEFFNL